MLSWLSANLANLVIAALLVLAVGLAVRSVIRNRKAGKCSCGCDCASCGAGCGRETVYGTSFLRGLDGSPDGRGCGSMDEGHAG